MDKETFLLDKATFLLGKETFLLGTFLLDKGTFLLDKGTFLLDKGTYLLDKGPYFWIKDISIVNLDLLDKKTVILPGKIPLKRLLVEDSTMSEHWLDRVDRLIECRTIVNPQYLRIHSEHSDSDLPGPIYRNPDLPGKTFSPKYPSSKSVLNMGCMNDRHFIGSNLPLRSIVIIDRENVSITRLERLFNPINNIRTTRPYNGSNSHQ
eukprot:sb/3470391/